MEAASGGWCMGNDGETKEIIRTQKKKTKKINRRKNQEIWRKEQETASE